jgi:purine-nucleoside phosphorylase
MIHVRAEPRDIAPFVLLPGDPGRAERISQYLEEPRLYTRHRGLLGYTGTYRGVRISVQTTGMGAPSAAIVAEELIRLGARWLLRVGTCGAVQDLPLGSLLIAQGAVPLEGTSQRYLGGAPYAPLPDFELTEQLVKSARQLGYPHRVGLIASDDAFYMPQEELLAWGARGVLAFEMEASALFVVARLRGVRAGALLTVSNHIGDPELAPEEILQRGIEAMIEVALASASALQGV